jgi:Na+-driven multidrug efflux pump
MTKDMTTGSPLRIILLFSIPVLLGNLFQQFYNMVDTIIVGRYLGEEALAAVGSTGCLMFLVLGFANGIAQGFGVMVSHAFGAKDFKLLRHYVALSLILTLIISLLLTIPTVTASRLLLAWMHTPENIIAMADAYIKVIFAGILLTMAYNVVSGILRGIGDSRTPDSLVRAQHHLRCRTDRVHRAWNRRSRLRDNHRTGSLRRALLLLYVPEIRYPAHQT